MPKKILSFFLFFLLFFCVLFPLHSSENIEKEQAGLLDIQPGLAIWTILTFLLLVFLLKKFAWKPILNAIEEREKNIQESIEKSEKIQQEALAFLEESKKTLAKAKEEAAKILHQTEKECAYIIKQTEKESKELKENTQKEIQDMQNAFWLSQIGLLGNLGMEIAMLILKRSLNKEDQERLLEEAIETVQKKMQEEKWTTYKQMFL